MKNYFTILFSVFIINTGLSQQLLIEDFNSTGGVLPAGWQSIDNDPEPHNNIPKWDMWHVSGSQTNSDSVIAASSWLNPATATADDWLISPPVATIYDSITLNWKAGSALANYLESYEVYVSTGNTITDFLATNPIYSTPGELSGALHQRSVSFGSFGGQQVYVAFRLTGQDKFRLEIDDIELVSAGSFNLNDFCANSIDITTSLGLGEGIPGVSGPYDNTLATHHSTDPTTGFECFYDLDTTGAQAPLIDNSLWFTFVGDGKTYEITSTDCGGGINYIPLGDTQFALYSGTCGSLTPVDCNEDYASAPTGFYPAGLIIPTTLGVTYYLMVDGWTNLTNGTYSVGEFCIQFTEQGTNFCFAGDLLTTPIAVCNSGTATIQVSNEIVPSTGEFGWIFSNSQGGTGGPTGNLTNGQFSVGRPNPFTFDSDLNGLFSYNNLPPLNGVWVVYAFSYYDFLDPEGSICSITSDSVLIDFRTGIPTALFSQSITGTSVSFTNTSTNSTSYSWNFGDGNTSTAINPTHTYAGLGTYNVVLVATNSCGTQQFSQSVTLGSAPTAGFSSNTSSGCSPLIVNFSDASTGNPTSWNWSFPGGTPSNSTQQNPTVTYNSAGSFDVFLTVTNALGNNSNSQTSYISVTSAPVAAFSSSVSYNTVTFMNNSTGATSYNWNFGDGNTSTMTNPVHTYAGPGTYNVTLSAINSCGNIISSQQVVISSGSGPVAAMTSNLNSGCAPLVVNFTDQSSGNPTSWNWSFPGGIPSTSTLQNPTVSYNSVGMYDITLTVGNASGSNTTSYANHVEVKDAPNAAFNFSVTGADATFTNNTTLGASSYSWDFGDGNISSTTNPVHTYASNGTYTVTLTATNACGTDIHTETVVVSLSTALEDQNELTGLTVLPNPNTGLFQVDVNGKPLETLELQVLNVLGVKVHEQIVDFSSGQLTTNIDLGNVPAGTYILAVIHGTKVNFKKIAVVE